MKLNLKRKFDKLVLSSFYILSIAVCILVLAEIGARIYIDQNAENLKPPGVDSEAYSYYDWREQFFEDKKKAGGGFIYEPFSEWKHADKESDLINVRNGYRVSWEPAKMPGKKDFVIFMFGGSTTYGIESPDELTIASLLARKLNESSDDYRYLVRNYGVSGFLSDQEIHLLIKLLRDGERPDAVIFYDGLNDTQTKVGLGKRHFLATAFQQSLFGRSSLKQRLGAVASRFRIVRLFSDRKALIHSLLPLISDENMLRQNAQLMLTEYEQNTRLTKLLAEGYGFQRMHFWGPSMFNTDKTLTPEEHFAKKLLPVDLYNANQLAHDVVAELAEKRDFFERLHVIDIGNAFDNVNETIFVDSNHVTPIGNAVVADAMQYWILREFQKI